MLCIFICYIQMYIGKCSICVFATRFREGSNVNAFAREKRANGDQIQYKKAKYHYARAISAMPSHLSPLFSYAERTECHEQVVT